LATSSVIFLAIAAIHVVLAVRSEPRSITRPNYLTFAFFFCVVMGYLFASFISIRGWHVSSQRIIDEAALLACCMYVDLIPIRAAMAVKPEKSKHTSSCDRIETLEGKQIES
jgi:hypothetical protein